jgi:hypothetical protein
MLLALADAFFQEVGRYTPEMPFNQNQISHGGKNSQEN